MHKGARTVLCGGRSVMLVPTAPLIATSPSGRIYFDLPAFSSEKKGSKTLALERPGVSS